MGSEMCIRDSYTATIGMHMSQMREREYLCLCFYIMLSRGLSIKLEFAFISSTITMLTMLYKMYNSSSTVIGSPGVIWHSHAYI